MEDSAQFLDEQIKKAKLEEANVLLRAAKLKLLTQILLSAAGALALIGGVATALWARVTHTAAVTGGSPLPLIGNPPLAFVLHGCQATIIFFFIRKHTKWLRKIKSALHEKATEIPIQRGTLKQFTLGWECMWWGWFVLYTWFAIAALLAPLGKSVAVESVSDVLDVVSAGAIWWCYLSLDRKSVRVGTSDQRDRPFWTGVIFVAAAGIVCIVLAVIDRIHRLGYFGVVMVGIFSALGLASFTGKIGSSFIGTRRWALTLLYFYAMLQVFYSLLPILIVNTKYWLLAVYICALLLKIVLAVVGYDMMRNGGLIRYLEAAESGLLDASEFDAAKWVAVRKAATDAS
jgi:hypothetical protein